VLYYKDLYWYFNKALSPKICDKIIKFGKKNKLKEGRIGSFPDKKFKVLTKNQRKILKDKRDSKVSFIDEKWLYDLLFPYVHTANKLASWNFKVDWSEPIQFTEYKDNQFYDLHSDSGSENQSNNKIRKLSLVASLTDPKKYKGGEFEFQFRNLDDPTLITKAPQLKPRGSIVVFPSFLFHRVKPIRVGIRYSLVGWCLGKPLR